MGRSSLLLVVLFSVAGCQNMGGDKVEGGTPALYNGDRSVLYQVRKEAQSAEQAMAMAAEAYRAGDLDQSLFLYLRALEFDPERYDALVWAGRIHRERGNEQLAELAFTDALKHAPDNPEALAEMGLLHLAGRRYPQARENLGKVVAADQQRLGSTAQAVADLKVDAQSPLKVYNGLGVLADLDNDFDQAQAYYRLAAQIDPRSALVLNSQGYSHYLAGRWPEAERDYQRGIGLDASYKPLWRNYGLLLVRMGRYEEAISAFEQVGNSAEASNDVGYVCLIEGKLDLAEEFFRSAIEQSPGHYDLAWQNLKRVQQLRRIRQHAGDSSEAEPVPEAEVVR
jgi:tetratricopeptide (TPR) repeat protein